MFSVYVTGTDTGIGKTLASSCLLHALRGHGLSAIGQKPVASGCELFQGQWRNADALALLAASDPKPAYADLNPYALPSALAPELAAADAGLEVSLQRLLDAHARLATQADALVVEGVGGWGAPLSSTLMQADLVHALRIPVVLVVGMRLGCLNHALLTARAITADGAHLAGWIASHVDPAMERVEDNLRMLRERLPAPCWGVLPHVAAPDPARMAIHLRLPMLTA